MLKRKHLNFKHGVLEEGESIHLASVSYLSLRSLGTMVAQPTSTVTFRVLPLFPPTPSCSGIAEISKDAVLHNLLPFLRVLKGRELRTLWKARAHSGGDGLSARTSFPNEPALAHVYWLEGTCARALKRALGTSPAVDSMSEKETNLQEIRRKTFTSGNLY